MTGPNSARVRIAISVDFEAEEDFEFIADGLPDYWDFYERQYGGRRGVWRLLETLREHDVKASFFTCSALLFTYPEASQAVAEQGHEIAAHTVHHEHLEQLTRDDEEQMFTTMMGHFESFYGRVPDGFRTCFPSDRTLDFVGQFGFFYDTTNRDDEVPYIVSGETGSFVEVPRGFNGDSPLMGPARRPTPMPDAAPGYGAPVRNTGKYNPPRLLAETWKRELDWLLDASDLQAPRLMSLTLHPYIIGRPSRARALSDFLGYAKGKPEVEFVTHLQVAREYAAASAADAVPA